MKQGTYELDGKNVLFEYEDNPNFLTVISIIKDSVDAVIDDALEYAPYLTQYMIDYNVIRYLTKVELPIDINECYNFVYESGIIAEIVKGIPTEYDFIIENTEKMVKFRKQKILNNSKFDELFDALTKLITTVQEAFAGLDVEKILGRLEKIGFVPNMTKDEIVKAILNFRKNEEENNTDEKSDVEK